MRRNAVLLALLWVTAAAEDAAHKCAVPQEYINDDYCDSPDGCDEPNTSACSTVAGACGIRLGVAAVVGIRF